MLKKLVLSSTLLVFLVVVFGAFVRLTDAGLGCPDWPGCYGHIAVPESEAAQQHAAQNFPNSKIETGKAWREMTHRYLAGTLGLLLLAIAIVSWRSRHNGVRPGIPILLVGLVIFQSLLGMWTVTMLLKPVIVTLHLLGGMTILSLLVWLSMVHFSAQENTASSQSNRLAIWAILGVLILFIQIALGGWVSSNYAALACADFPMCDSQWLPAVDFHHGFQFTRELGVTIDGEPLPGDALNAIHWTHRVGALVTFLYLFLLGIRAWKIRPLRICASWVIFSLVVQVSIGISNVVLSLPLPLAVAHNAGAALLLASLIVLVFKIMEPSPNFKKMDLT